MGQDYRKDLWELVPLDEDSYDRCREIALRTLAQISLSLLGPGQLVARIRLPNSLTSYSASRA